MVSTLPLGGEPLFPAPELFFTGQMAPLLVITPTLLLDPVRSFRFQRIEEPGAPPRIVRQFHQLAERPASDRGRLPRPHPGRRRTDGLQRGHGRAGGGTIEAIRTE